MAIKILPDEIASQIAAGEVVERPASVVKELLENALDAGATSITINIKEAGKKLIEISDNGGGIPSDEIALAVTRHATSKLASAEDLFRISTLGFRGEALASIGSVSRMTMTSRLASEDMGARLRVEGGKTEDPIKIGVPVGTVVKVENLFFNVPARLKFLKTDATERRHIDALVTRYALAYPNIRIHLIQDEKPSLQTSGSNKPREVLASLYGTDIAKKMLTVNSVDENFKMTGFISPAGITKSNRREITFFVNGRWVQDSALASALIQAYHTLIMVGRYPIAMLNVNLPADMVDVNVHPTKAEIRFRNQNQVFSDVQQAVRRALLAHSPVPGIRPQMRWAPTRTSHSESTHIDPAWNWAGDLDEKKQPFANDALQPGPDDVPSDYQDKLPVKGVPLLKLVGQVATAFLVAEGPDGLYLIDQHAAHERILFEKFLAQKGKEIPSQLLMNPVPIGLPPHQAILILEQLETLNHLGFQVEEFGHNTFLVRALPVLLSGMDPAAALRVLVEDFEEDETPLKSTIENKIIARVCKRAAIKAGQTLAHDEQQILLRDLEQCESPRTCPHGRPTMIHLSVDLLERQFGRRGPR